MEEMLSASDQQSMVSSFLEIAVGQTADTARQFLQVLLLILFLSVKFPKLITVLVSPIDAISEISLLWILDTGNELEARGSDSAVLYWERRRRYGG